MSEFRASEAAPGDTVAPSGQLWHRRMAAGLAAVAPLGVAAIGVALARSVLLPGQGFWDTGEFQTVGPLLGTAHPTGYPSYVILGWLASIVLAPLGEPAFRMNLLSALLLGSAAGLMVVLVRQLTGRAAVATAAGLLLVLTPIPWHMGTFADPHTFHLALLAALTVLLVGWGQRRRDGSGSADRWLLAAAVLYGVMLGNHSLTLLLAPGIALFVLAVEPGLVRRPRFVGACAASLVGTAALLFLELPIRAAMGAPLVYGRPDTPGGFAYVVLAAQFRGDVASPFADLGGKLAEAVGVAQTQLGPLVAAVPAAFLVTLVRRPRYALLTGTWLLVTVWFATSYTNAEIDRYYLGPIFIVVTWLGIGFGEVLTALLGPGDAALPGRSARSGLVRWLVAVALAGLLVLPAALAAPTTRSSVDQSGDTRATDWSRWVLDTVEPRAVVISWWSVSTPLWYRTLVLGERPDVWVVDDRDRLDEDLGSVDDVIRASLPGRPVYIALLGPELSAVATRWQLERVPDPQGIQSLYRVIAPLSSGRAGTTAPSARPAAAARPAGRARSTQIRQARPARMGT